MAAIDDFNAAIQTFKEAVDKFGPMITSYVDLLTQLESEDPCTQGFAQKLSELETIAGQANAFFSGTFQPAMAAVNSAYNNLGFFEKRNSEDRKSTRLNSSH